MGYSDDGTWVGIDDGQVDELEAAGTASISDHAFTFDTDDGCPEGTDGTLTFRVVGSASCGDRRTLMDDVTYTTTSRIRRSRTTDTCSRRGSQTGRKLPAGDAERGNGRSCDN